MTAQSVDVAPQLLTVNEREQVLYGFNDTTVAYPADRLVHELFEEQSKRAPDAVAVISGDQTLTYAELNCRANQLAWYLRDCGVQTGDFVPILMPRCLQMLIAQLAVLKCGGVYVPVDPDLPKERRDLMLQDCSASCVLVPGHSGTEPGERPIRWIDCARVTEMSGLPTSDLQLNIDGPPPAFVMYTSGSTGIPKGVMVPHRAVIRLVINNGYASIREVDCVAHCSNPAFDASTFEIWGALLNGARVVILPQAVVLDPVSFPLVLEQEGVTILFLTTALFNQHVLTSPRAFARLEYFLFGGEVANPSIVRRIVREGRPRHLLNMYGPTEATTFATWWPVDSVTEDAKSLPIGRPISNTQVYILDAELQPVPIGVAGEIFIGGAGVACGYLNRSELTAERFLPDPFRPNPRGYIYRTGDVGRWLPDGNIEFLARNDLQVKIRGFRVELGEVEARLADCPGVAEAIVVAREDRTGDRRLVAYVTTQGDVKLSAATLRTYMGSHLPEYMVPGAFVIIEKLPLTSNGKVDRAALPPPDESAVVSGEYEAPQSETERVVAGIWQHTLGLAQVSRHNNFFELGGNSLLGMQLIAKLSENFGVQLYFVVVFQCPTVQQMAQYIDDMRSESEQTDTTRYLSTAS